MKKAIIIFTKHPEKGKVKTRLAATIGEEKAVKVYELLLHHTATITKKVTVDRFAFYADRVGDNTYFHDDDFSKQIQKGNDLGEKMYQAFKIVLNDYDAAIILGGDCYELNDTILENAFEALETNDAIIGPAKDGGYYLLGLKEAYSSLFLNKEWSTESVCQEALDTFEALDKSVYILPTLSDVDYEEDLGELKELI